MTQLVDLGKPDAGSFRDPSGSVHVRGERVFRTVKERARIGYEFARDSGLLGWLQERGLVVTARELDKETFSGLQADVAYVLEHELLPWIAFPYEWTFSAMKKAALLHLDVQIAALERGVALSDATAYNVQFVGTRPVFIDTLSFRRYRDGEFWAGHRQFCEQFLNPLLMGALLGVRHNAWYRGTLEGIDTLELNRMLGVRHKLSWNVFTNVTLQARLQQKSLGSSCEQLAAVGKRRLDRRAYEAILRGLRGWIAGLSQRDAGETVWQNYSRDNTYSSEETQLKHSIIERFAHDTRPRLVWDLGCNTGEYSETLLRGGADYVVGIDFDHGALENAFARADRRKLRLQPMFQDAANPSPDQGWRGRERRSLVGRARPDAIVALAFEHHLAIGRNIPLAEVVEWLVSLAPRGIIEFVQKDDETIRRMLALRDDIFDQYTEACFTDALENHARVVERVPVSGSGRVLFWFERRDCLEASALPRRCGS